MKKIVLLLIVIPLLSFTSSIDSIDLIGKWKGDDNGQVGFITFDKEGYVTIEFEGQVIGGKEFIMNGKKGKMTYELNEAKNPIEIDFTITKLDSNEQKKILCIAKFENENNMVFAMTFDSQRPSTFSNENSIRLKRME